MDLDGGGVGITDVILILRCVVALDSPTPEQSAVADFDCDGDISISDVVNCLRVVVGLPPVVPYVPHPPRDTFFTPIYYPSSAGTFADPKDLPLGEVFAFLYQDDDEDGVSGESDNLFWGGDDTWTVTVGTRQIACTPGVGPENVTVTVATLYEGTTAPGSAARSRRC